MGSFTERKNFSKFVSLDVEEAGKEHFTNEQGFFQIQIAYFVFWVNRNFSLRLLEFWKDSKTLQIVSDIWRLIHLMQIKPLHSGVT